MNAPDLGVITPSNAGLVVVKLEAIRPSKTNPRKHFDEAAMAELADSVKQHGVIQPILVRPFPDEKWLGYELVAGERRYRAAKAAGLAEIPAIVRELTDLQALELQVVENLKRADLHPLEEAEGYERLMNAHGMTADAVAEKIGKSKGYVYARLKLTALCKEAREAFYEGKLNPSTALYVARIPGAQLQMKATKEITEPDYRGEPLSVRTAAEHIQRNYMLRLDQVPFKTSDPDLVKKAGACTACPKRAGNQPELFGDVAHADTCTDPTCFGAKKLAHWAQVRGEAEAKGIVVFSGKEAKEIRPRQYGDLAGGWTALDRPCFQDEKARSYEKLVGKALKPESLALLEDPATKALVRIAKTKDVNAALKEKGIATPRDRSAEEPGRATSTRSSKELQQKWERDRAIDERVRMKAAKLVHDAPASAITREDMILVAGELAEDCDFDFRLWWPDIKDDRGWLPYDKLTARLGEIEAADLGRFMVDVAFNRVFGMHGAKYGDALLERRGIDLKQLKAEAKAEIEAEAAAKKAEPKAAKKAKGKKG